MKPSVPNHVYLLAQTGGFTAFALLILLSCLPNASTRFFTWPWTFYGQLLLLVPVFLLGACFISRPSAWRREWTVLGLVALAIGISVTFSQRPAFSLESSLFLFSGLAWCGLVALKISTPTEEPLNVAEIKKWARLIGVAFLLPLIAGLIYWCNDWYKMVGPSDRCLTSVRSLLVYRNQYPFGHWNYTGGFALLALPWFGALLWIERGRWRSVWLVSTVVGAIMFFSASSRGAVLGLLATLATAFISAFYTKAFSRKQTVRFALAGCVLAAGLWAANPRLRTVIVSPSSVLLPNEGDVQRIGMLQGGWLLVRQRPWIGHGPGMTPFIFPEVRSRLDGGVETVFQLHNGPLQLWVDHGLLGLLCAIALAAVIFFNALRWLKSPPGYLRTFALVSAYSLVGYFVMFVTDYQLNVLAFVAALGLEAGLVLAAPVKGRPTVSVGGIRLAGSVMLVSSVVASIMLIPAWRARQAFWGAWTTDVPAENIARLERAVELAPRNPYYLNQLALRRARLAETVAEPTAAALLRTRARDELAQSIGLDAAQEPVQAALGWLWLAEDPKQAEIHFRAAIALLPDRDTVHFGLALSRLAQGDQRGAIRELSLECLANPLFIASPLWPQEPFLPLRSGTIDQLFKDYASVISHPDTPAWRKPQLIYAAAFARWWLEGQQPNTAELKGALSHQQQFFEYLSAPDKPLLAKFPSTWGLLEQARQNPAQADAILHSPSTPPTNNAIAGALARLATSPADLPQLLRSASRGGVGIVSQKITRGHYAIMNNVLDGPGYEDLAPRFFDAFTSEYAGPLFPLRSSIPGPVMLDLMKHP